MVSMTADVPRRQTRTGDPLVQMTFRMPAELHQDLTDAAAREGLSRTAWMISVIAQRLDHPEYNKILPTND